MSFPRSPGLARLPGLILVVCLVALAVACTGSRERRQQAPAKPKPKPVSVLWSTELPVSVLESASVGDSRLREVQGILSDLGATHTAKGIVITLPEVVLFDFNKSDLRPDARPVLTKITKVIDYYARVPVSIEGHTDAIGTPDYNQGLSERRASAVKDWLTTQGSVPASRLGAKGFGETRPVAPNQNSDGSDNPAGRQKNRRVEVVIATG
jgi:outer membrane protein OmpA-like peptidoglycan-associated protein